MPGSLTTISVLDANGNSRPIRVLDESGSGDGPFQFIKIIAPRSLSVISSTAIEQGRVFRIGSGAIYSLSAQVGAVGGWVLLLDATSIPSDGSIVQPVYAWQIPPSGTLALSWSSGAEFTSGCTVVFSTTGPFTKTGSATAFFSAQVGDKI